MHNFAIPILMPILAWIAANFEFSIGVNVLGLMLVAGSGLTNKEARRIAHEQGYEEVKVDFDTQNKPAFQKGNIIITPDRTGHNGGVWKRYNARTEQREVTLDKNLEPIKK